MGVADGAICVGGEAAVLSQHFMPIKGARFRYLYLTIDSLAIDDSRRQTCCIWCDLKRALETRKTEKPVNAIDIHGRTKPRSTTRTPVEVQIVGLPASSRRAR